MMKVPGVLRRIDVASHNITSCCSAENCHFEQGSGYLVIACRLMVGIVISTL